MPSDNKLLNNVKPEEYFILRNGRVLKNLYELTNSLTGMDDETFRFHVTKEKNDFANWIRHVFKDEKLANQISRLKNRDIMIKKIKKRISNVYNLDKNKPKLTRKKSKQKITESKIEKENAKYSYIAEKLKDKGKEKIESSSSNEFTKKLNEILLKEKEIELREQKIQEIEDRIEKMLSKGKETTTKESKFFSKEFVQGLIIGLLITAVIGLIYIKFFY